MMYIVRRLRAFFGGYFWLPCPICGRMFGGFETADEGLMTSWYSGECVCKRCEGEAKKRNKRFMEKYPMTVTCQ